MLNKNGIALLAVLVTLLVVAALANVTMNITLSQSRLTRHKVSRIQAYYATTAGVNYALDKLRLNDANWIPANPPTAVWHYMCRDVAAAPCLGDAASFAEPNLSTAIEFVLIRVAIAGAPTNNPVVTTPPLWPQCNPPAGVNTCVNARAVYTFQ